MMPAITPSPPAVAQTGGQSAPVNEPVGASPFMALLALAGRATEGEGDVTPDALPTEDGPTTETPVLDAPATDVRMLAGAMPVVPIAPAVPGLEGTDAALVAQAAPPGSEMDRPVAARPAQDAPAPGHELNPDDAESDGQSAFPALQMEGEYLPQAGKALDASGGVIGSISASSPASISTPLVQAGALQGPNMSVPIAHDLTLDGGGMETLARDIALAAGAGGQLRFQLHPASLGALRVEIQGVEGAIQVSFTADSEAARSALVEAQSRLTMEARAQGVRVTDMHFQLSGDAAGQRDSHPRRPAGMPVAIGIDLATGTEAEEPPAVAPYRSNDRFA